MQTIREKKALQSLTRRALELHPNRKTACKWVLAVRWLRSHNLWIMDGNSAKWRSN